VTDVLIQQALVQYFPEATVKAQKVMSYGKENTSVKLVCDDGRKFILRVWGAAHSHIGTRKLSDIKAELAFMVRSHEAGLPVPVVYRARAGATYVRLTTGQYGMLMDFVPGRSPRNTTIGMLQQIAELMARLHLLAETFSFPTPRSWPGTVIDMTNQRLRSLDTTLGALDETMLTEIAPLRRAYEAALSTVDVAMLPRGPIHGDIMWENVKFQAERLSGLFDFDDCRDSYFLEDIIKTLLFEFDDAEHSFLDANASYLPRFLEAYEALRPLTPGERAALPLFMTAGYLYRYTAYVGKWAKGDAVYRERLAALQARYRRHAELFLLTT
jgi:homoserine kinase type II